jgi:hypothetical protein
VSFNEALKIRVRKKAHFCCCLCHAVDIEIHHIIPEAENGPDNEENAAPLCASCHNIYGANPQKRKLIREARDHWFEVCQNRFESDPDGLEEIKRLLRDIAKQSEPRDAQNEGLNRYPDQPVEGTSPSREVHFELRGDPHELGTEVWLWKGSKRSAVKLCDTAGWGNLRVHFSPDDRHILIRDGGSSMGIDLRLFSRAETRSLSEFREEDSADIGDKAEQFALQKAGLESGRVLHHRYMGCLGWSDDSNTILIRLSGYGNRAETAYRMDWIGTYELRGGRISEDLSSMNRNAVKIWNKEQRTSGK